MVQLGEEKRVAKLVDVAMTNSLKPYSLNLPGLSNYCFLSPIQIEDYLIL
jgi:hypothetical protein